MKTSSTGTSVEPFSPIAVVGQGCVLPGAHSPEQLWDLVVHHKDMLGVPPEHYWGVEPDRVATSPDQPSGDHTWSAKGGYVRGFEQVFDATKFQIDASLIMQLDPLFQWTLEAARQAWEGAGYSTQSEIPRAGVILGNLSYPTRALSDFALEVWQHGTASKTLAYNRYMSGLPAQIVANALGARGEAFCLDAACASSLYAIKLASEKLQDNQADVMLVGGVNHADDLFLHIGFCALKAMSRTGQSRPFHSGADGLVPAEGAGFVVLKRLEDAIRDGNSILGVIRGVGLSNDGRGRGMLTPSQDGQYRAMMQAYQMSGLQPEDISMIECHATGTPLGDATELRSMATIFEESNKTSGQQVPIGSLKSNLGHLITASGVAGLLKVLSAMKHKQRPPTIHVDEPVDWLDTTPFRLLTEVEPWESDGPRRAAINNFGFGGNNAHLLVEEWTEQSFSLPPAKPALKPKVAVVAMSAMVSNIKDADALRHQLMFAPSDDLSIKAMEEIEFDITQLKFPPNDLVHTLPQQLLSLKTAMQLSEKIDELPGQSTGIYMGMQCDTEIARYGARWRMANLDASDEGIQPERDKIIQSLEAAGVLGTMPNIVANRMNSQFNLLGPSYTVSSEEASGLVALKLAMRALLHNDLDAAIVGAADLCADPVHEEAARQVLDAKYHQGGDVGIILILKRLDDAIRDGDTILATLDPSDDTESYTQNLGSEEGAVDLTTRFGHAHAASGLLHLGVAALCTSHNAVLSHDPTLAPTPNLESEHHIKVTATPLLGNPVELAVQRHQGSTPGADTHAPMLHLFSANSIDALKQAVANKTIGHNDGPFRLAVLCEKTQLDQKLEEVLSTFDALVQKQSTQRIVSLNDDIFFSSTPIEGETSFVFTGPAGAYKGMGRELLLSNPQLLEPLHQQFGNMQQAVGWIYDPQAEDQRPPVDKLWGSSFLCQVHAQLTRQQLKIPTQSAIGFCSGETNALFAMGAWYGLEQMHADINTRGVFDQALGGHFEVLQQDEAWPKTESGESAPWQTWRALCDEEELKAAIEDEPNLYLTIISAPGDCVMAGDISAAQRVMDRLGAHRFRELGYNLVMHAPKALEFKSSWYDLHHRPTTAVDGVRFYTNASCSSYEATSDNAANALTSQAMTTVDFPALVQKAYDDGVRIFIEHGPLAGCSKWISKTLKDQPHLAVSLDAHGKSDVLHISQTLAQLFVAGVDADWSAWSQTAQPQPAKKQKRQICKSYPAHLPAVTISRDPMQHVQKSNSAHATSTISPQRASASLSQSAPMEQDHDIMIPPPELPPVSLDHSLIRAQVNANVTPYRLVSPHEATVQAPAQTAPQATQRAQRPQAQQPVREVRRQQEQKISGSGRAPSRQIQPTKAPQREFVMTNKKTSQHPQTPQVSDAPQANSPSAVAAKHFEQLSKLHQEFLEKQAQIQQEFLQARGRILEQISQAQHGQVQQPQPAPAKQPLSLPVAQVATAALISSAAKQAPRHDDVALSKPLFAPTSTSFTGTHTTEGALPTSPQKSHVQEARAKHAGASVKPAAATKTSKKVEAKTLKTKSISKAPVVSAPAPKSLKAPKKGAPKSATANMQKHDIIPSAQKPKPVGPTYNYDQIAIHASGKISEIFGSPFEQQDDWKVQVRMPEPPLLLCHRVTGIDCQKGVVGTGSLWCESDIPEDAWYLNEGRMPVGIMIESGQADLMLISYMGADFENKGDRVYRLLGCELMFHGGLAQPGDILKYDIHIDGHAKQDAIRLFFFHYDLEIDGKVRLSVRNGQAGFFSYDELAESNGVLWVPADEDRDEILAAPFDAHPQITSKRSFSAEEVQRFSEGGGYEVFGKGFEKIAAHTRTPSIQSDKMRFMDEVIEFDPTGGPWNRGYLKAIQNISDDDWFFDGHFLNDPCMPGTLMFEGCVQVMAFYMAACGWTVNRDGWIFEPVPFERYPLRCRGQVAPGAKQVVYEVMVREVHDGDIPKVYADLMCSVDGLKAFHCGRMGLQLTPDWPMDGEAKALLDGYVEPKPVATAADGHAFDYDSLIACAWGRPTRAFGSMYKPFDSHRTVARLPGPPYHFISRVTEVDQSAQNAMRSGCTIKVEYDVPADAWYFRENGAKVMPYAVLLEAALQPCGWLASYVGCALTRDDIDLAFRNLDGTTTQFIEVTPETGSIETRTTLTNIARAGGNIIVSFDVEMTEVGTGRKVLTMDTVFGFFPPDSLANQVGLPIKDEHRARFDAKGEHTEDLTVRPEQYCANSLRMAEPMLLMLDRVTVMDRTGGEHGLGFYRAEKDVDPNEWFFKAHFFQDPVQPGSLGLEALLQLLQFAMLEQDLAKDMEAPRFEAIALNEPIAWKYRGQVLTHNETITSTLEIKEIRRDEGGILAIADGSLWVDGMRIYQSTNIGMRVVDQGLMTTETDDYVLSEVSLAEDKAEGEDGKKPEGVSQLSREFTLDPTEDSWLLDHCPTYTDPALPMMSIIDLLVGQAQQAYTNRVVVSLEDVKLKKWVIFTHNQPRKLRTSFDANTQEAVLELWWDAPNPKLSRYDEVARGKVKLSSEWPSDTPEAFEPLDDPAQVDDPYQSGELFHGESFQLLTGVWRDEVGAQGVIDLSRNAVPAYTVQPGALDAALQILPHDNMELWWKEHAGDTIAYPHKIESINFYSPTPQQGELRSEVRFVSGQEHTVTCDVQVWSGDQLWMAMRLTEILFPKGPLGRMTGQDRQSFIRDCLPTEGASLATLEGNTSTLDVQGVLESNWFKGTLETLYHVSGSPTELALQIAAKELVASKLGVHPEALQVDSTYNRVFYRGNPLFGTRFESSFDEDAAAWTVTLPDAEDDEVSLDFDMAYVSQWWADKLGLSTGWFGDDLYRGMIERFVRQISFEDLGAMRDIEGRSVLFLGNHEVQIESLLITILGSVLTDSVVITMANAKHEKGWVGQLIRDLFSYPECVDPKNIVYFNQSDPASMFDLIAHFKQQVAERQASVMVHAPGTRARSAGEQVERISSALIDMALDLNLVIVPVNFSGGLPHEQVSEDKLEFPFQQTGQDYRFGSPLLPEKLKELPYGERRRCVLDAINRIAPTSPGPNPPELGFDQEIQFLQEEPLNLDEINATLLNILMRLEDAGSDVKTVVGIAQQEVQPLRETLLDRWSASMASRFS